MVARAVISNDLVPDSFICSSTNCCCNELATRTRYLQQIETVCLNGHWLDLEIDSTGFLILLSTNNVVVVYKRVEPNQ